MKVSLLLSVFLLALSFIPSTFSRFSPPLPPSSQPRPSPTPILTTVPTPPTPAPTPETPTTLIAPSSSWAIRYTPSTFLIDYNTTSDIARTQSFPISSIHNKFATLLGADQYNKQTERLSRYSSHLERRLSFNHSHEWKGHKADHKEDKHHKKHGKHYNELSSFYLRHAQCRACTAPNYDLLMSSSLVSLPSYQPYEIMKFCPSTVPLLPHETAPSASSPHPLQDWEGVCVSATSPCPTTTLDLNILSPTTCSNDLPITKQSCALCVLDGYEWRSHRRAVKGGDNYDGQCVSPSTSASQSPWSVSVRQLDECPSAVMGAKSAERMMEVSGALFLFVSVTSLVCCCVMLKKCCAMRKVKKVGRGVVMQSIAVPDVSSSASQPGSGYPGQVAQVASQRVVPMHEPLLSQQPIVSGLNPPMYAPAPYAYPRM